MPRHHPMTIHKYPIFLTDHQRVALPAGATILTVQFLRDDLCLWAIVDPNQRTTVPVTILIYGDGHPMDALPHGDRLDYLATVQHDTFAWHVFRQR